MFITAITNRGNIPVLEKTMAFAEARQLVLAENIANIETPGYRTRHLDPALFQRALSRALDRRGGDPRQPLAIERTAQFRLDAEGRLQATPATEPPDNILFHDRTNARIERLMTDLADNQQVHNLAGHLLKECFDRLKTAIKGTV